jgi:hypothetical protein
MVTPRRGRCFNGLLGGVDNNAYTGSVGLVWGVMAKVQLFSRGEPQPTDNVERRVRINLGQVAEVQPQDVLANVAVRKAKRGYHLGLSPLLGDDRQWHDRGQTPGRLAPTDSGERIGPENRQDQGVCDLGGRHRQRSTVRRIEVVACADTVPGHEDLHRSPPNVRPLSSDRIRKPRGFFTAQAIVRPGRNRCSPTEYAPRLSSSHAQR